MTEQLEKCVSDTKQVFCHLYMLTSNKYRKSPHIVQTPNLSTHENINGKSRDKFIIMIIASALLQCREIEKMCSL